MRFRKRTGILGVLAVVIFAIPGLLLAAGQTLVKHQNLSDMVAEADRIYRGQVTSAKASELEINGSSIPTTTYRILISEHFKGDVEEQKGDQRVAVLRAVGTDKKYLRIEGNFAQLPVLPDLPNLEVGSEYLIFANAPNAHGLSNTIGLGQGYFSISVVDSNEMAANELENLGLFKDMGTSMPAKGAVAYSELADMIRAEIAGGQQ